MVAGTGRTGRREENADTVDDRQYRQNVHCNAKVERANAGVQEMYRKLVEEGAWSE